MPASSQRRYAFLVAAGAAAALALVLPKAASAHAFLVRSAPEAGARLAKSPASLTLYFSEPFVAGSERVVIRRAEGGLLSLPRPVRRGTLLRQPLPRLKGVFVVNWRVLADDGHLSTGEFAFAVGPGGQLPELKAASAPTPWTQIFASWLFFAGLALSLGGLVSERLIWRRAGAPPPPHAPVAAGIALAALASLTELLLLAGNRVGGGLRAGFDAQALERVLSSRPGVLTAVTIAALALAAALRAWRRDAPLVVVPLLAAALAVSLRGHSGTSGHAWAVAADFVHLSGAAVWIGALAHLVRVVLGSDERAATVASSVRRYLRLALPTVLLILLSGLITALAEFRSPGELFTTGYGQTLLVKSGIVALALSLAFGARRFALSFNRSLRLPLLRRLTAGEVASLFAVLVAVAVLVNVAPPRSSARGQAPELGPPPLTGRAVRLADLAGQLVVAVAASERELHFRVLPPTERAVEDIRLSAEAELPSGRGADLYSRPCGPGCFVIRFRLPEGQTTVIADVSAPGWEGGTARFEIPWPLSRDRSALLARVARTMRQVPALVLREGVTSDSGDSPRPVPYSLSGGAFMKTELYGGGAVDVRMLGREGGLTELAFALPASDIWYRIWIDRSYRVRRERIISRGHLILRSFGYPPRARAALPSSPATAGKGAVPRSPRGAVVLGREDDDLAVGLAIRPDQRSLALTASVLGPDGDGAEALHLRFRLLGSTGTVSAPAQSCGAGCYRTLLEPPGKPQLVLLSIEAVGRAPSVVRFPLPARWPPPRADLLLRRATRIYRSLRTLVTYERLASSNRNALTTTYKAVAPDRLAYQIRGGPAAIIIGDRRWDRDPGGSWKPSPQLPIRQPSPPWGENSRDARLIAGARVAGRSAWVVSFFDPRISAWFTIWVDKVTMRTLELRMVAAAHFMHHRYSGFNEPIEIAPPR